MVRTLFCVVFTVVVILICNWCIDRLFDKELEYARNEAADAVIDRRTVAKLHLIWFAIAILALADKIF